MIIFLCSPRHGGYTDRLGAAAQAGARSKGDQTSILKLADFRFAPCNGCQICSTNNGVCAIQPDASDILFNILDSAQKAVFVSPIYFYALPGQFKLFIDRSQKFWAMERPAPPVKKAGVILAAGRKKGEKLFAGALLTLKWFLKPFGYEITDKALFRGLDNSEPDYSLAFDLGARMAS